MIKYLTGIIFLLFVSLSYAEGRVYNYETGKGDVVYDKASEISYTDNENHFGSSASPPTVQSSLYELVTGTSTNKPYVPYTGANANVDLGTYTFNASQVIVDTNLTVGAETINTTATLFIRGSGTGTGFALRIADTTPTDRLVVLDNGNVGIGITAPTQLLDVSGTANATTITEGGNAVFNSTEVPGGELGGTWASPTVDATHSGSAHHSAVTMSGVPDYITLSGQDIVRAKLDITDDTNATGGTGIGITANDLTFVATELSALTWSAGGSAQFSWDWNLSAGDPKINFNNNSINIETGNLGVGLTNPIALLQVGTSPAPGLVVTAAGNVGIANTAPIALLQVGTSPGTAGLTVTGGNVGVGTTSPTAKLYILAATTAPTATLAIIGSGTGAGLTGGIVLKASNGTCGYGTLADGTGPLNWLSVTCP